jgi:PAS domain S-box-containing protein
MIKKIIKNINNFIYLKFIGYSVKNSLLLLIFLTILPATFLGTYLNFKWREQLQKQDLENAEKTGILIAQSYYQILRSSEDMLTLLKKNLTPPPRKRINTSQILMEFLRFNRRFSQVLIMNEKGAIGISSHRVSPSHIPPIQERVEQALATEEMVVTDMHMFGGEEVIFFILPFSVNARKWVIVAPMPLHVLHSLSNKAVLPKTCTLAITDRQGKILGHNALESRLKLTELYPDKTILQKILQKNYGVFEHEHISGTKILYNFLPIHTSKGSWSLILTYSKESLFEATNRLFQENITIFWISLLLSLIISLIISYFFISRPLKRLLSLVKSLEQGQPQPPYFLKGEFETVAQAFKEMARRLADRRESLEKSYHWFSNIVELAGEAIISFDRNGVIHFGNKAAHHIFGREKESLKDQDISLLIHKDSHHLYKEMLLTFTRSPQSPVSIEDSLRGCRANGTTFPMSATLSRFNMEDSTLYVAIIRDITLRKKQEEVQSRYNSELERSNSDLEDFAYTASHDLQEPLRMISMYLELLETRYKENLDTDGKEFIEFAVDGAHRMQAMIKALLSYARAGRLSKSGELVDPQEIISDVLRDLKWSISESKTQIEFSNLPLAWSDKVEMKQVFLNIISNSIKFRSDLAPQIRIWGEEKGDRVIFHVKDNGIGFDPKFSERIFGLFQRLHSRDSYKGTGIGLALVKKIIQRRGGEIWVTSGVGKGATFSFSLPSQEIQSNNSDYRSVA